MKIKEIITEEAKIMSRAAKGHMKYGKEGMKALAKAGKEGKDLDPIRQKYDRYDEAANPAQQAAIAISMKKAGKKPKKDVDEVKQRLDPKCWTGYHKAGTKIKGGVRVNNCVKDESVDFDVENQLSEELELEWYVQVQQALIKEFAPDEGPGRGDDGRPQFMEWQDFIATVANLVKNSFDVKQGFKNKKLEKKQAVAKFVPHDPYEYGPVMLYAYRDSRPPFRIGVRAHMQVGTYGKHGEQILTQYKIPKNMQVVDMTPANATMVARAIMQNKTGALIESSGHIPKDSKEAQDPRWSNALTVDIGPGEDKKQAAKLGFKVSNSGPPKVKI